MVDKHDQEKDWECENCGKSISSKVQPQKCPCGSDSIQAREQLSMMEKMMKDYLTDDNQGQS